MTKPTLTSREMSAVEHVLEMGGGYVLNFSDRTFANFFADYDVDIDDPSYAVDGGSKGRRMRAFLRMAPSGQVARVLTGLLEHRGDRFDDDKTTHLAIYRNAIARLQTGSTIAMPVVSAGVLDLTYVQELETKTNQRLAKGDDDDGAITTARTMLEAVLEELDRKLNDTPCDHKGDLMKLFKVVAKRLRIDDERADLDDNFKQVVRGLVQVVNGLAPIRNKMSDGHARVRKPAPHHARVIVNAAKTVATFLVESYIAQREKGLLQSARNA